MWEGKRNIYKTCDFLFDGQTISRGPFKAFLHVVIIVWKSTPWKQDLHVIPCQIMCEKNHKKCDPFHAQTITQA
jgi:hypothetical protein